MQKKRKMEKSIIDIARSIAKNDNYISDIDEFSKKLKHLIEGICKIDNLGEWLLCDTVNKTSISLKLAKWNDDTYKFFKKQIKELIKKYTFEDFESFLPSRKTEITSEKLYPVETKKMLLIRELRLLLFEVAAQINPEIRDKAYYTTLYKICSEYVYEYSSNERIKKEEDMNKRKKISDNKEAREAVKEFYSIVELYYNEFLKLSLISNEYCFPYDLDQNDYEVYCECCGEYKNKNLNQDIDLDNLIKVCRQRVMNRMADPEDIDRELRVNPTCIEFDMTNTKTRRKFGKRRKRR